MVVKLEMTVLPVQVRAVIGNRPFMEEVGQTLVKTLLNGYCALLNLGYLARDIQPSTVYVSEDFKEVNFTAFRKLLKKDDPEKHSVYGRMPYNPIEMYKVDKHSIECQFLDTWAIGIMLLEVITSTEMVISIKSIEHVETILNAYKGIIDEDTLQLLTEFLTLGHDGGIERYIGEVLSKKPNLIGENIRATKAATEESSFLRRMKDSNQTAMIEDPELFAQHYDIDADCVVEEDASEEEDGEEGEFSMSE